ncbi:MAG: ATP-grasp domain-containing protein [Myxococcota bacterium]|nr:ATP-grasp domain-containing protein [Myxococcota bacterium]
MHIILVAPEFPANQRNFARALREAGAFVTGIGERPVEYLDGGLRGWLNAYEQVPSVCDEAAMVNTVRAIQSRGPWVHRIEATVEAHILPVARVRTATKIPGQSIQSALLCRDKPEMKDFLRKHGIATAASAGVSTFSEAKEFAEQVGYPLIIKPRAGAGADGTSRVNNHTELAEALAKFGGGSVALEEFIEGHEGFYDTLTVNGEVSAEFISHYYPGVLEAMRTRDVSPVIIATNRAEADSYNELKVMGRKVITAMGLDTTATHMEWFFGPKGLKFSEIGARPPGVGHWDVYSAGNDIDLYRQWAEGLVNGRLTAKPSRRYAAAKISLRPNADGVIKGYQGLDAVEQMFGRYIVGSHIPSVGSRTMPIEAGYHANAWMIVRHPDYDELRKILDAIGKMVTVHAG